MGRAYTEYSRDTRWANLPWEGQKSPYIVTLSLAQMSLKNIAGKCPVEHWDLRSRREFGLGYPGLVVYSFEVVV